MDKATYMAMNGITEAEYDAIMGTVQQEKAVQVSPSVLAIMESLINRGPRAGRRSRVGAARTVPLAYTHR